ncbi:PQQ-binding-like beta-propeller repeat protein [Halogeometricum sp. S1BR25-6]|uniref:PQQ-binding-like beta-propeller repeat protein n=1 Tax=Halogeometricum salsisoli TaxID=2950536 RepID=A0ABU2GAL6_9EURY|nr:PQQ-binding-like beta-propeller repeat protein [Halogeometricum sp. S1BR25-6]MDS0297313.1 PQQ-binding-like beta-propeller repeat protein [Halogeometricum sp. S1BR25-6]
MRLPRLSRRRLVAAGGLSLVAGFGLDPSLATSAESGAATRTDGWPTARRDPARTGFDPDGDAPRGDFSLRWRASVPPVEYETRSFGVTEETVYVAGEGRLVALDAESGAARWQVSDRKARGHGQLRFSAPPTTVGETVVAACGFRVFGFDAGSGRFRWAYDNAAHGTAPLVVGRTGYWPNWNDGIAVVDVETGIPRERSPLPAGPSSTPDFSPLAARDGILVGRGDVPDELAAVDSRTGTRRWTVALDVASPGEVLPCLGPGAAFYGSGPLYAISLDDGEIRWESDADVSHADFHPVTDDERVYAVTGGERSAVVAFDAETGERVWRTVAPVESDAPPAVVDETLYAAAPTGFVVLDTADGTELARFEARENPGRARPPAVVDGTVYAGVDRALYAVEGTS